MTLYDDMPRMMNHARNASIYASRRVNLWPAGPFGWIIVPVLDDDLTSLPIMCGEMRPATDPRYVWRCRELSHDLIPGSTHIFRKYRVAGIAPAQRRPVD